MLNKCEIWKKGLRKLTDAQRSDARTIISLWRYEAACVVGHQLPRHSDLYWFDSKLDDIIKEVPALLFMIIV